MKLLFVLVMLTAEAAGVEDLSGKMFTFPVKNNKAHVRLNTDKQNFHALTLCHRSFTDLPRVHSLFSMATTTNSNNFLIIWVEKTKEFEVHVRDIQAKFHGLDYKPNMWHSICTTWDAVTGLVQMWFNGQPLVRKFTVSGNGQIGTFIIILGQEQDSHGGGFDSDQSFVGMMSDVHMWDYVLSACEIQNYMQELNFIPGNVLNWKAMDYQITDKVLLGDKIKLCY